MANNNIISLESNSTLHQLFENDYRSSPRMVKSLLQ